jgi:hypothetical protein
MVATIDKDINFLDTLITWADDIYNLCDDIIEATEDPEVIVLAKAGQSKASLIEKKSRDYRPRLMHLKKNKPDSNGTGPGRNEPAANKLT